MFQFSHISKINSFCRGNQKVQFEEGTDHQEIKTSVQLVESFTPSIRDHYQNHNFASVTSLSDRLPIHISLTVTVEFYLALQFW